MVDANHLTAGHALIARMRAAHHMDAEANGKLKKDMADWYEAVKKTLSPTQLLQFTNARGGEADWVNYADLIHNDRKQLAADLAARLDFLAGEK